MVTAEQEIALAYLLDPAFQIVNTAGKPLTDGWIEVYIHGTRNKYYCYSDWNGALHPFQIPLDSLGANIVLASPDNAYDIYVYNKFGSLVMSRYNVVAGKGGGGSGGIPSSTEAQHWLGQYGATQPLTGNSTGQTLALPSNPDYQGDFVDHIDYGTINGDEVNQYPKYMYLKPGLYLVNCVIRFQQQSGTEVNRLDETLVYTGNGNANEDIAWQLDETGPLATGDRHCLKMTFIRKVLDEGETSPVDCKSILYFAPAPQVNWKEAYIQTLQIVKLNSAVQGGGGGSIYKPGEGISIDEENIISVTGMQPASAMGDYVTYEVYNEFVNNVTGDINILQNEIDAVSAAVSGGVAPEYEAGYGIIIEGDTISVDPSVMPTGCVSQEELNAVTGDIINQIENVTGDVTEITNIINNVTGDVTNLTEVVNNVTGDVTNLTEIVEGVTGDVTNIITEISNVTGDIVNINENVTNLTEVVEGVTGDVTNITNIIEGVTEDISDLQGDITNITNVVNNVTGDVTNLTEIVEGVTGDITNLTEVVNNVTGDVTNLTEVVNNVTGDVHNLTEVVNGVTGDIEQLNIDIQTVSAAIPDAQVNADWAATGGVAEILNKPEIETITAYELVAGEGVAIAEVSGQYIISASGQSGGNYTAGQYISIENDTIAVTGLEPQVNADWFAASGVAEILNKPVEANLVAGDNITITSSGSDIIISSQGGTVTGDYVTQEELDTAIDAATGLIPDVAQADWAATGGPSEILNKPDIYGMVAGDNVQITVDGDEVVISATGSVSQGELDAVKNDLQTVSAAIPDTSNFIDKNNLIGGENVTISVSGDDVIVETTEMASGMQVIAGDGIKLTPSGDYLIAAVDETVLWSGTFSGSTGSSNYITLSEATTNFNTIEITMGGTYLTKLRYDGAANQWQVFSPFVSDTYSSTVIYSLMYKLQSNNTQVYCNGITLVRSSGWSSLSSMNVGEVQLTKVVGIGRK